MHVASSCDGYQDDGVMIAAASDEIWNGGGACGRKYQVTCTGATNQGVPQPCTGESVVVKIIDYCPPPRCQGTIDLSQEAFSIISDPNAGKITIDYAQYVISSFTHPQFCHLLTIIFHKLYSQLIPLFVMCRMWCPPAWLFYIHEILISYKCSNVHLIINWARSWELLWSYALGIWVTQSVSTCVLC